MRHASAIGLCADCRFSAVIQSSRGSVFYQCRLSFTDPRFEKYPRLPVIACSGYIQLPTPGSSEDPDASG